MNSQCVLFAPFYEKLSFYCPFQLTLSQGASFGFNNLVVPGIFSTFTKINSQCVLFAPFDKKTLSKIPNVSFLHLLSIVGFFGYLYKLFRVMTRLSKTLQKCLLALYDYLHYIHFSVTLKNSTSRTFLFQIWGLHVQPFFAADKLSEPHFIITN